MNRMNAASTTHQFRWHQPRQRVQHRGQVVYRREPGQPLQRGQPGQRQRERYFRARAPSGVSDHLESPHRRRWVLGRHLVERTVGRRAAGWS